MAHTSIREQILLQVLETPLWVRDACIGLIASGMAITAWSILAQQPADVTRPAPAVAAPVLTTDAREARSVAVGAPLLWKVTNGQATVYLFGSVHVLNSGLDWMDPRLFQAFDSADAAWFEVPDLDKLPHFKGFSTNTMASKPVLSNGLTDLEKHELEILLNRYNYTLKDVERVQPWAMAGFVEELSRKGGAFVVDKGPDMTLFHRAKALKLKVGGFESNAEHYGYLYALGGDMGQNGTEALKKALASHFGRSPDSIAATVKDWRIGDQKSMTAELLDTKTRNPRFYDLLLVQRNAKWMPKVETMLKGRETVFIVAGIDHFIGPDGLVAQLRARGYSVERVDS